MTAPTEEGTVELQPCPFCGGEAYRRELIEHYPASVDGPAGSYSAWFHIGCVVCGIEVGDEYESAAISAWNRRASRSPVVGAVGGEPTDEQKDAARYRWLRAKTAERHEDFYADVDRWSVSKERRGTGQCFSSDRLDAAIDAAMGGIGVSPTGSPEGEVA